MLRWFQALLPKEDRFFDLFERHSQVVCAGARTLRLALDGGPATPEHCATLARLEGEADAITREALLEVRRTFITPFDRSDIHDLISSMDDAIDQMHRTTKTIMLFEQRAFEPEMVAIGDLIVRASDRTAQAMPLLRSLRQNATELNAAAEEIGRLEEQSDQLYDRGMGVLFRDVGQTDPLAFVIGSKLYDHLEKVVDRLEDVANEISGVLIEQL